MKYVELPDGYRELKARVVGEEFGAITRTFDPFAGALRIAIPPAFKVLVGRDPPFDQQNMRAHRGDLKKGAIMYAKDWPRAKIGHVQIANSRQERPLLCDQSHSLN
jgi:hypothetical protein